MRREIGFVAAVAGMLVGCQARNSQTGDLRWTTYDLDASALLANRCGACHGATRAEGGYRIDSYLVAVSRRDDGSARVTAGDANSALLMAAAGQRAGHSPIPTDELNVLQDWVVRSRLAKAIYTVHEKGWMNPADESQFHGLVLRTGGSILPIGGYHFEQCTSCHGTDLQGGSAVACTSCHTAGVTACNTCHGDSTSAAPPRDLDGIRVTTSTGVGAHRSHVTPHLMGGVIHAGFACTVCHQFDPASHYTNAGQPGWRPVNVTFSGTGGAAGMWDRNNATCLNSYCHTPSASDTTATHPSFKWTLVGINSAACGTCHGVPPSSHADTALDRCPACHQQAYAGSQQLPQTHANGVIELGRNGSGCSGCHGDATSPAPWYDVFGRTDERLPSVGAHGAHLEARHRLRGPIACTECHLVPTDIHSPGHIDHQPPAVVFPGGGGVLARTDGALPSYDPAAATCGSVYCHAGGMRDSLDRAVLVRTPTWTGGISQAACGACHGIPPLTPTHPPPPLPITQCVNCHPSTIDATGALIVTEDPVTHQITSTHLNGIVEHTP